MALTSMSSGVVMGFFFLPRRVFATDFTEGTSDLFLSLTKGLLLLLELVDPSPLLVGELSYPYGVSP